MLQKKMLKTYLNNFNKRGDGHLLLWLFGTIIIVVILLIFLVAAGVVSLAGIFQFTDVSLFNKYESVHGEYILLFEQQQTLFAVMKTPLSQGNIRELVKKDIATGKASKSEYERILIPIFNFIASFYPMGYWEIEFIPAYHSTGYELWSSSSGNIPDFPIFGWGILKIDNDYSRLDLTFESMPNPDYVNEE